MTAQEKEMVWDRTCSVELNKSFKCIDFEKRTHEMQSWFEKVARYLIQNQYMKIQKFLVKVFGEVL